MVWQKVKFVTLNCSANYCRKTDKKSVWTELISLVPYVTLWDFSEVSGHVPPCPQSAKTHGGHSVPHNHCKHRVVSVVHWSVMYVSTAQNEFKLCT